VRGRRLFTSEHLNLFVHKDAPLFNVPQLAGHKALARELKVEAQAR